MKTVRPIRALVLALLAAAPLLLAAPGEARAQGGCVSGAQARALVQSGQVLPLSAIVARLQGGGRAEIVDAALCGGGGGYVYRLTVLGQGGRVSRVTVNARSGQVVGGRF